MGWLCHYTNQYNVIISDISTSWRIPTYGRKVIAGIHAQAFIKDHDERKHDLVTFFNETSDNGKRAKIIRKYNASYILIDKSKIKNN